VELHGTTALIAIDVQKGEVIADHCGIPHMLGGADRHARTVQIHARTVQIVNAARQAGIAPIYIQEVRKRTLVDFGRELDGVEGIHCLEGDLVHYTFVDAHQHDYRCRAQTGALGAAA
jgi:nicotinamidase-related amidase